MTTQNDTQTIVVPEAPAIPELTFRRFCKSDYTHMKSIFDACKDVSVTTTTSGYRGLLKANDYQESRWGYRMTRPVSDPIHPAPIYKLWRAQSSHLRRFPCRPALC